MFYFLGLLKGKKKKATRKNKQQIPQFLILTQLIKYLVI